MLASVSSGLFEEVNKVGRAQFAEGDQRFGASINGLLKDLLRDSARYLVSENKSR